MNRVHTTVSALAVALISGVACAETQQSCVVTSATCVTTETFDGGTNDGGWCWNYFSSEEMIVMPGGGNPGAYLATPEVLVAQYPVVRTTSDTTSSFTGNYAAKNVQRLGFDLLVMLDIFSEASAREITLRLVNDNDTPSLTSDDWGVELFVGTPEAAQMPSAGSGWKSFEFDVPSTGCMPDDAVVFGDAPQLPWTTPWAMLMQDVDRVEFASPPVSMLSNNWQFGIDNIQIENEVEITCPADLDVSGDVGFVDLTTLLAAWGPCP